MSFFLYITPKVARLIYIDLLDRPEPPEKDLSEYLSRSMRKKIVTYAETRFVENPIDIRIVNTL